MPWNNQGGGNGGGPWGSPPGGGGNGGGNNPWGRPPGGGGGGGQPPGGPDLEELLRKGQERFKNLTPGGLGGGKGIALGLVALGLLWGLSGIYRVQPDEQGVVRRFGEYVRTEQPGLRYHLPAPIEMVDTPKVTLVNRLEVGYRSGTDSRRPGGGDIIDESLMLTGDENIIDIDFTVLWVIKDAGNYLFKIRDPANTVKMAAESAMREVIGRTDIQPALTEARQDIEQQTKALLQTMLDEYQSGIEITQVQLQKVDPPAPVVDAFNDVQRARQDRERLRNEAEAYRNDIIPRARGEAEQLIQQASAYREQVVSLAQGDAQRFAQVLSAYTQAPEITARRMYLETMQEVLGGTNKIIIDQGKGSGVVPFLPLNELTNQIRQQTPAASAAPRQ
ncbi:FtsH protease activity modulator HflK [Niveispirillum cyanobacteriorum]|uniref:Protein HflK n=1 Tax=Niveispirillum cyanobacteriorum TaxID=1612173 RepID=A0A2K9NAP4_9PROT|nr:FtsH protease activity modulator HflK [Niveispirillum cyanobacteriorum]AUN30198.1 FtsH protease activity modulator HflK [Niveispirillum cyanobacteriorum]GGE56951.1 protease modulator HflK [Niveispirillum cyanobacteriorum]